MGLGIDGANVMTGEMNGVTALIALENPFTIPFHCAAHRAALCLVQACEEVADMQSIERIISTLYSYIQNSPVRLQKFKDLAKILDLEIVKFKRHFEVRLLHVLFFYPIKKFFFVIFHFNSAKKKKKFPVIFCSHSAISMIH